MESIWQPIPWILQTYALHLSMDYHFARISVYKNISYSLLFCTIVLHMWKENKTKNLAIANRLRISCTHNSCRSSVGVTLKSRLRITQGDWKRSRLIDHARLTISQVIWWWIILWPKKNGVALKTGLGFVQCTHLIDRIPVPVSVSY